MTERQTLRRYAVIGAQARIQAIQAEQAQIRSEFPELFRGKLNGSVSTPPKRKHHTMSAAARKAVSERMRRYWSERKKAEKGRKKGA